jgi:hypothetical protein
MMPRSKKNEINYYTTDKYANQKEEFEGRNLKAKEM